MTTAALLLTALCIAASSCGTAAPQTSGSAQTSDSIAENTDSAAETTTNSTTAAETAAPEGSSAAVTELVSATVAANAAATIDTSDLFTSRDYETECGDECTTVTLSDSGITVNGSGASAQNGVLTITEAGTYKLSGTIANGRIVVDADDAKVQIVLDGASVTCAGDAALYVKSADKVFVTTTAAGGTLASTGEFPTDSKTDGAVFSKSDLTLNGTGTLTVSCETAHGIVCKDDLKITCGTYNITAAKKGIDCNDSVRIADGSLTITSGTDGIHAENSDDASKAFVYVGGGSLTITSGSDAIDASGEVMTDGGTFIFVTNGGTANASAHTDNGFGMRWDRDNKSSDGTSETSCKGIKADGAITINGGTFTINSADDAVHTNTSFGMTGGSLTAASGDDGIHADANVTITDGTIAITESYEGIEGEVIEISGGNITVTASDDGMNAAGGDTVTGAGMFEADPDALLHISGGYIIVNANGDGLDSNGTLLVSGGETYVSGPTNSGNGSLDSGVKATVTGGIVIAAGATGMAENFGSDSAQCSILCTFDGTISGGTEIKLTDSAGNVIASFTPEKNYQCAVISAPGITVGETYTVTAGSDTKTIQMTGTTYGAGSNFGGGFGMNNGGFGGNNGGFGGRGGRGDKNFDNGSSSGDNTETPQQSDSDTPQMPDGEMPQMPDGEMPQMPNGEMPQMPNGEMPQMPNGEMPQMSNGEMPQMPNGGRGGGRAGNGGNKQNGELPVSPNDTSQT